MPQAIDIFGTAYKNGSAVLLARVVDGAGDVIQQSDVDDIQYSVFELDPCRPDTLTVVAGHEGVSLDVSDVIFDTLQTGGLWTVDAVGYNFRHEMTSARMRPSPGPVQFTRFVMRSCPRWGKRQSSVFN